jgi:hypothetical protein
VIGVNWQRLIAFFCFALEAAACSGKDAADAVAECGSITKFHQDPVGCINFGGAQLGEVYAVALDGSVPPLPIGAFAPIVPAAVGSTTPEGCDLVIAAPVTEAPAGLGFAHSYDLPTFTAHLDVNDASLSVKLDAKVAANQFSLTLGQMSVSTLNDPSRLLGCSPSVVQAVGDYMASLTVAMQTKMSLFVVTQIVSTDSLKVTAADGTDISAEINDWDIADVKVSVTYSCDELVSLPNGAAATPVFFNGSTFSFDGATFRNVQTPARCNAILD